MKARRVLFQRFSQQIFVQRWTVYGSDDNFKNESCSPYTITKEVFPIFFHFGWQEKHSEVRISEISNIRQSLIDYLRILLLIK